MIRFTLLLVLAAFALGGCGALNRVRGVPDSNPAPGVSPPNEIATEIAPAVETSALPGAQSAAALDQTTEAERAAAVAAPAVAAQRELGRIVVGLGPVTEQGFWLKSALVTAPAKGRVVTATGASVAVDLLPSEGGALLSLAAFRALELSLTELPEVIVYAN